MGMHDKGQARLERDSKLGTTCSLITNQAEPEMVPINALLSKNEAGPESSATRKLSNDRLFPSITMAWWLT